MWKMLDFAGGSLSPFLALIFLSGLRLNRRGHAGGVLFLRVGARGVHRPPDFATGHTQRDCATGQQGQYDRLNDLVPLFRGQFVFDCHNCVWF